jgi:hypothetical protein
VLQLAFIATTPTFGERTIAFWHIVLKALSLSVRTMGTTLFALVVLVVIFLVRVVRTARRGGWSAVKIHVAGDAGFSLLLTVLLWFILIAWHISTVLYTDHQDLLARVQTLESEKTQIRNQMGVLANRSNQSFEAERKELLRKNEELQAEVFECTHGISTQTPAFSNINELVGAFRSWRAAIGPSVPCRVELTAPPDVKDIAMVTGQLSVIGSNCPTFGPGDWSIDPDEEKKATTGMVPKTLVIHLAKGVRGDVDLYNALQNVFVVKRSYDVPPGSPQNFVWLQFGTGMRWNTQLR